MSMGPHGPSPASLHSQHPKKQDIFLSIKDLCLILIGDQESIVCYDYTSRLKKMEKLWNILQCFKRINFS